MVVLSNFEQFAEEADKLYSSAPAYTRYTFKYRHCDGKLVLKVTNDIIVRARAPPLSAAAAAAAAVARLTPRAPRRGSAQTLTYATDQAADLRKLEKFNAVLCARMCGTTPLPPESGASRRAERAARRATGARAPQAHARAS